MSPSTATHDLKTLMLSFHPVIVVETVEEERIRSLLQMVVQELGMPLFEWSVVQGLVRPPEKSLIGVGTADPLGLLRHIATLTVQAVYLLKDFARHLEDAKVARQFREVIQMFSRMRSTIVLTDAEVRLPADIEPEVVRYDLQLPGREELLKVLYAVLRSVKGSEPIEARLTDEDRGKILNALQGLTLNQARQAIANAILHDGRLTADDVSLVLKRKAQMVRDGGLLEYYPLDENNFELGGFANLKTWLQRSALGFSREARDLNLTAPRGILLVGVPGCGKSLAAKVIAREWKLPLLKLDAGRLLDKYIGESEKNFRKATAMAEAMAPVVLWIDEIEKGLVSAGSGDADAGLSRRLFGAFLTWLQEKRQDVFVVATANDLHLLPPELLRKGRFDEIFFVDLPDAQEREAILKIHLALRKQDPALFDLPRIVQACEGFSGAEIEQAVIAALYRALFLKRPLDTDLLLQELRQTIPLSVTRREEIQRLRTLASGRFVHVSSAAVSSPSP